MIVMIEERNGLKKNYTKVRTKKEKRKMIKIEERNKLKENYKRGRKGRIMQKKGKGIEKKWKRKWEIGEN